MFITKRFSVIYLIILSVFSTGGRPVRVYTPSPTRKNRDRFVHMCVYMFICTYVYYHSTHKLMECIGPNHLMDQVCNSK